MLARIVEYKGVLPKEEATRAVRVFLATRVYKQSVKVEMAGKVRFEAKWNSE